MLYYHKNQHDLDLLLHLITTVPPNSFVHLFANSSYHILMLTLTVKHLYYRVYEHLLLVLTEALQAHIHHQHRPNTMEIDPAHQIGSHQHLHPAKQAHIQVDFGNRPTLVALPNHPHVHLAMHHPRGEHLQFPHSHD